MKEKKTGYVFAGKQIDMKNITLGRLKVILSETETMNHVNHAMITNYYTSWQQNQILYIILPLYSGGDLRNTFIISLKRLAMF